MILNFIGLGLLFISILYTGYQGNVYFRLSRSLGKLLLGLSPSKAQKRFLLIGVGVFVVLLVIVSYSYISAGISLNANYSLIIAVVIFSSGRFLSSIVELRENGIFGQGTEISYKDVKTYKVDAQGKRATVAFQLTDGRVFTSLFSKEDEKALAKILSDFGVRKVRS